MFLRELLEITLQYDPGIYQSRRGSLRQASFHLQQQAFPQISRSHSCRIETLHDTQQGFNLLIVHLDPRPIWFFRRGNKAIRQEVTTRNPYSRITYTEYIELKR